MPDQELTQAEREAMTNARVRAQRSRTIAGEFEIMWTAARNYYFGKGYTPRSMLRLQAAKRGVCPICHAPQPGSTVRQQEEVLDAGSSIRTPSEPYVKGPVLPPTSYVEVIEKNPVLDLLERAMREIGTDGEGDPPPVSHEIAAFLRAHGRLKGAGDE